MLKRKEFILEVSTSPIENVKAFRVIAESNDWSFATHEGSRLVDRFAIIIPMAQSARTLGLELEEGPLQGLVLDLRNNPGGVLQSAVAVADLFVEDGLLVYTSGRLDNARQEFRATGNDVTGNLPIVVLVNEGSASASEIVAGALQDHDRAVIMGNRTFGKGSVQTILPLNEKKAIKLTTALYYTPSGRSIQAEGITPDIRVDRSQVTRLDRNRRRMRESDLHNHLNQSDEAESGKTSVEDLAITDFQLNEALTLLRGYNILADNGGSK